MSNKQFILIGGNGKHAGKSSAALAFANHTRIAFADPLKDLVAHLYGLSREALEKRKDVPQWPLTIGGQELAIIADHIGQRAPNAAIDLFGRTLPNIRATMQFLGTDVIRKLDPDWHVNKLLARIEPGVSYVVDDPRFKNELNAFPDATTFYILRPDLPADTHESENSLSAADFGTVVVNDGTVAELHEKIKQAIKQP